MGLCASQEATTEQTGQDDWVNGGIVEYERSTNVNPEDYIIKGARDTTIIKPPMSINGEQFIIDDCQGCDIFLFDFSATVTIDKCVDCRIFVGPSESSVYFRDCKDCKFVIACGQLRTRDSSNIDLMIYSRTQPTIEATKNLRLACFDVAYENLRTQFSKAGLDIWNNPWSVVHDFSDKGGEGHDAYTYLPAETTVWDFLDKQKLQDAPDGSDFVHEIEDGECPVPRTTGVTGHHIGTESKEHSFLLAFGTLNAQKVMSKLAKSLQSADVTIKKCTKVKSVPDALFKASDPEDTKQYSKWLNKGQQTSALVGFELYYHSDTGKNLLTALANDHEEGEMGNCSWWMPDDTAKADYFFENCMPSDQI